MGCLHFKISTFSESGTLQLRLYDGIVQMLDRGGKLIDCARVMAHRIVTHPFVKPMLPVLKRKEQDHEYAGFKRLRTDTVI
jgi:hypothetical protein